MRPHLDALVRWCRDAVVRSWPTVRDVLVSYWTAGLAFVAMTALHGRWLARSVQAGEVLSGYGAGLVMLGIFVASRPYIRAGLEADIAARQRRNPAVIPANRERIRRHRERVAEEAPGIRRDAWAERVIAVAVVLIGTFLNGYGTPLARRWDLPTEGAGVTTPACRRSTVRRCYGAEVRTIAGGRPSAVASAHAPARSPVMPIPRRSTRPVTDALGAIEALRREIAAAELDPLDDAVVAALVGLSEVMQAEGETLDALRRRMVRLGIETLG